MDLDKKLIKEGYIDIKYFFNKLLSNNKQIVFYIFLSTFLTGSINAIPLFFSKKVLNISLPYKVELNSLGNKVYCLGDNRCKLVKTADGIIQILGNGWTKNLDTTNRKLSVVEDLPLQLSYKNTSFTKRYEKTDELKFLQKELNQAEEKIRTLNLEQQQTYLKYISDIKEEAIISTETYVRSLIDTRKRVGLLEAGLKPVIFGNFYISNIEFKPALYFSNPFEFKQIDYGETSKNQKMALLRSQKNSLLIDKLKFIYLRYFLLYILLIPSLFAIVNIKK